MTDRTLVRKALGAVGMLGWLLMAGCSNSICKDDFTFVDVDHNQVVATSEIGVSLSCN